MNRKNEIKKELEEIAPFLNDIKKEKSGFQVPDNYFKEMQNQVIQQLNESPAEKHSNPSVFLVIKENSIQTIRLLAQPRYALRAASFVLVLTVAAIFYFQLADRNNPNEFLTDISAEDMYEYVNENIDEFELEEIMEYAEVEGEEFYESFDTKDIELDNYIDEIIDDFDIEELDELL